MVYTSIRNKDRKGINMNPDIYQSILKNLVVPVVFVDNQHIIRFMNDSARKQYAKFGEVLNKSIFDCHHPDSKQKIITIYGQLLSGANEMPYSQNEKQTAYMRAVRDSQDRLLGYYERFEAKLNR
jgi:DUF438 domain-containing protein